MVVFHDDNQVSFSHKLVGQRRWCVRICASRLRLDARVIPEHIFSGRASQLVGGANEQDFLEGNLADFRTDWKPVLAVGVAKVTVAQTLRSSARLRGFCHQRADRLRKRFLTANR
jgi:hypothetical protein